MSASWAASGTAISSTKLVSFFFFLSILTWKAGFGSLGWIFSILPGGERTKSRCQFSFFWSLDTACVALIWGDLNSHCLCREGHKLEGFSRWSVVFSMLICVFSMLNEYWFFIRKETGIPLTFCHFFYSSFFCAEHLRVYWGRSSLGD